jgi:hypothetical protein
MSSSQTASSVKRNRGFSQHIREEFYGGHVFHMCKLCGYSNTDLELVKKHAWTKHMQKVIRCKPLQSNVLDPESNEALDGGLKHLVKGAPFPDDVTILKDVLDKF